MKCYPSVRHTAAIVVALLLNVGCGNRARDDWKIELRASRQATTDAAERVCIQRLSKELDAHPKAWFFDIECGLTSGEWHAVQYNRRMKTIGYESDVGSGMSAVWTDVDDAAVVVVANQQGTLEDFGERTR